MEVAEMLKDLDKMSEETNRRLGRWQMYKMVLQLAVPVASQLPASFISALERLDPNASP